MPSSAFSAGLPAVAYVMTALGLCKPEQPPKIDFILSVEKPEWSYQKTSAEMKRELPPMSKQFPVVRGYTHSVTRDKYNISFVHKKNRTTGLQCVWPEKVTVTVSYTAKVYIAKNYPRGGCRDIETRKHELRHVNTDMALLEGGVPKIRAAIEKIMKQPAKSGPVDDAGAGAIRQSLLTRIKDAVSLELKRIEKQRTKRHAAIDSAAEYTRLSRACGR